MPDITYVDQYIADGKTAPLSLSKFYDTVLMRDNGDVTHITRIPIGDTFLKYREHFSGTIVIAKVIDEYFYKPKLVSDRLYGTTEMWISLLRLNNMRNVSEFNRTYIKTYDPEGVDELIKLFFKREGKVS